MKFRLKPEETNHLNLMIQSVLNSIVTRSQEPDGIGTFYKMRRKFAPNSLDIYLTQKERAMLLTMLQYRAQKLAEAGSITGEMELIDSIMRTIE